jgi:hypothetical protein
MVRVIVIIAFICLDKDIIERKIDPLVLQDLRPYSFSKPIPFQSTRN